MRNKQTIILLITIGLALFSFRVCRADGTALEEAAVKTPPDFCELAKRLEEQKPADGEDEGDYNKRLLEMRRKCDEKSLSVETATATIPAYSFNGKSAPELDPLDKSFLVAFRDFAQLIKDDIGYSDETLAKIDDMVSQGWTVFDLEFVKGVVEDSMNICEGRTPAGEPSEVEPAAACADAFPKIIVAYQELLDKHEAVDVREMALVNAFPADNTQSQENMNWLYASRQKKNMPDTYLYDSGCSGSMPVIPKQTYSTTTVCESTKIGDIWMHNCHPVQIAPTNYGDDLNRGCHNARRQYDLYDGDTTAVNIITNKTRAEILTQTRDYYRQKRMPLLAASRVRIGKYLESAEDSEHAAANYAHAAVMYERYKALSPEQAARVYFKIADGYEKAGNAEQAEKYLDKADDAAMANPPNDASFCAETFLLIGKYALGRGENLKAKNRFESAEAAVCKGLVNTTIDNCAASPLTVDIFDNLAAVYELLGNSEDAEAAKGSADEMRRLLSGGDEPQSGEQGGGDSGRQTQ